MKLHYLLYFVIGSVASDLVENLKSSKGTSQNQPKEYGPYKKDNVYDGERDIFQKHFGDIDNENHQISVITETMQNVTEQINRFHRTQEIIFPLDSIPLFFIPNSTRKLPETANTNLNQNGQKFNQNSAKSKIQELGQMSLNHDLIKSKTDIKRDVQDKVRFDSTPHVRRDMQLDLINRNERSSKMHFLQQMLKDYQISAQSHGIQNTWKIPKPDYRNNYREILQPGFSHDLEEFLHLERDHDHVVNMTNDFPKRVDFKPVHDNESYEVNRDSGIESSELSSSFEPEIRILGILSHRNFTDRPRNTIYLSISRNRENHDAVQYYQNIKKFINDQLDRKNDFGTASDVDQTLDARNWRSKTPRESAQFIADNIGKELMEVMPTSGMRKRDKALPRHILTRTFRTPKPIRLDLSTNMRKPVQLNPDHNMREPVKVHPTHNLQKPVQLDPTYDMRKPVQLHPSHDLRRPVKVEPTHDLRRPVKVETTHDLRKPVKLMESHDLRWPVIEEPDHNMRIPITEADIYDESDDEDGKLKAFIRGQVRKLSKSSFVDDPLYELMLEDEFIFLKCSRYQMNFNSTMFIGDNTRNAAKNSMSKYHKLFNASIKACGIPFNQSTDNLRRETKLTKWPWMVSLQQYILNKFWHKCAGSLINKLWITTAAHCVESKPKWDFLLQLGMNENYIERFVDRITIHPKFNSLSLDHDIALIRMDAPVTFQSSIVPICLPWKTDEIEKKKAVVLTWRLDREKNGFDELSRETVPVLTNKECEVMFSETGSSESIQKSFVCASFENVDQESCGGDSGGPLVIFDDSERWILAGIYSWGKSCRTPNQPEVYIRISGYTEWIEKTILCYEDNIPLFKMD